MELPRGGALRKNWSTPAACEEIKVKNSLNQTQRNSARTGQTDATVGGVSFFAVFFLATRMSNSVLTDTKKSFGDLFSRIVAFRSTGDSCYKIKHSTIAEGRKTHRGVTRASDLEPVQKKKKVTPLTHYGPQNGICNGRQLARVSGRRSAVAPAISKQGSLFFGNVKIRNPYSLAKK